MAINADLIKKKLDALKRQGTNQNALRWTPGDGENLIRILPYKYDKEFPFVEIYFHYNIGKKTYIALTNFNEPDPIAQFAEDLKSEGDKESWTLGNKIEPKLRFHLPIVIRGKEKEGVKIWSFGKDVYGELLKFMNDPDYGDITDVHNGRDVIVDYLPKEKTGKSYGETSVRVKPKTTAVTDNEELLAKLLDDQPNIIEMWKKPTFDDLSRALEQWLNPENKPETETQETTQEPETQTEQEKPKEESKPKTGNADVKAKFGKLFNDNK